MELEFTSEDLKIVKMIFDRLPKDNQGTLEVIAQGETFQNPSWHEIESLHRQYGQITIEYNRPE